MSKRYLKTQLKNSGEKMNKQAYYSEVSYAEDPVMDQANYAEDEEPSLLEKVMKGLESDEDEVGMDIFPTGVFSENDFQEEEEEEYREMTLQEALKEMELVDSDESIGNLAEELNDLGEEVEDLAEEYGDIEISELIPGSDLSANELEDNGEEKETDYANDGDLSKFMDYITAEYPGNIPSHDGRSTTGCEKAIVFLDKLNSQISRAIKDDVDSVLDLSALEDVRTSIMKDIITLKNHLNNLKRKIKDQHTKKASDVPPKWENSTGAEVDLIKEATTPNNMVITITPFLRAITGMMINAHVSAGKPMNETFEALKKKYDITDREELEIIQVCMDSGFPIFKDRGTISGDSDEDNLRVDFLKNYLS